MSVACSGPIGTAHDVSSRSSLTAALFGADPPIAIGPPPSRCRTDLDKHHSELAINCVALHTGRHRPISVTSCCRSTAHGVLKPADGTRGDSLDRSPPQIPT